MPHKPTIPTIDTFPVKSSQVKSKVYKSRRTQYHTATAATAVSSRSTVWVAQDSYSLSLFLSHCAKPRLTFSTKKKGKVSTMLCVYTFICFVCAHCQRLFTIFSIDAGQSKALQAGRLVGSFPFFLSFFFCYIHFSLLYTSDRIGDGVEVEEGGGRNGFSLVVCVLSFCGRAIQETRRRWSATVCDLGATDLR